MFAKPFMTSWGIVGLEGCFLCLELPQQSSLLSNFLGCYSSIPMLGVIRSLRELSSRPSCLWVPHTVESSLLTTKRASKSHDGDLCRSLLSHLQVLPGSLAPTWSLSISQLTLQVRSLAAISTWFLRRPIGSWYTFSGLLLCPYLRIW